MADYRAYARAAATRNGIDAGIFERQISQESGFRPDAYNAGSGATGIAQIVRRWHPNVDPTDPIASLDYAADLMRKHLDARGGDWALALSNYNAGPTATTNGLAGELDGWPYAETVRYVMNILDISEAEARRRLTGATPVPTTTPTALKYNPDAPTIVQNDDWSCAPTATRWALTALGRSPSEAWIEAQMQADGIVSTELGLLDASGARLAAWITEQYAEPSETGPAVQASNQASVSFDDVRSVAGSTAVLIGGRRWGSSGHWTGVRRYDAATERLILANPGGTGPVYGQQTLNRQEFDARGPWSAVILQAVGAEQPAPEPEPVPPATVTRAELDAVIASLTALRDRLPV